MTKKKKAFMEQLHPKGKRGIGRRGIDLISIPWTR